MVHSSIYGDSVLVLLLGVLKRMDWLLDLMGYIRNLAHKSTSLQNVDLKEVHAMKIICSFQKKRRL